MPEPGWVVRPDLTGKLLSLLSDTETRDIVAAAAKGEVTAAMLEQDLHLPLSTVYRKVGELKDAHLLIADHYLVKDDGKREGVYICPFEQVIVSMTPNGIEMRIVPSGKGQNRLWFDLFYRER